MGRYLPLFSIEVEHQFFSGGLCRRLEFIPTPRTRQAIRNAGLLTRSVKGGIRVVYDDDYIESLRLHAADPDEPLDLGFKVFSRDPGFGNYTEPEINQGDSLLYFDSRNAADDGAGRLRLTRAESAGPADLEPVDSPLLEAMLDQRDRLFKPVFVVNINLPESRVGPADAPSGPAPASYYLRFDRRQTVWKYYLMGDLARDDLYITDLDNQVEFVFAGQESLADNRTARAFRSQGALPLQERSDYRFQLRDRSSGNGRALIRRLPVASAGQISRETIDGAEALVSEMFVSC